MKEETYLAFKPEMDEAIAAGRKTQTRRVLDPQPGSGDMICKWFDGDYYVRPGEYNARQGNSVPLKCPYGKVGDRLVSGPYLPKIEITDIRLERLCAISNDDAKAEGIKPLTLADGGWVPLSGSDYINSFIKLWESIYGADPEKCWSANPWVWVIEFKKVEG